MTALGPANKARTEKARAKLDAAMQEATMGQALAVWGGSSSAFWKATKRYGRRPEAKAKFAKLRTPNVAGENRLTRDELIEDAEFLARTGETREGATRRLGYRSWGSLYARLSDYDRLDIADRFTQNGEGSGHVRQGSIFSATNGARM